MIERPLLVKRRYPISGIMASRAILQKEPNVHLWFLMALDTFGRGTSKLSSLVTTCTGCLEMGTCQWKSAGRMIEINHLISSVVAIQTILAKFDDVLGHEFHVMICVATSAGVEG